MASAEEANGLQQPARMRKLGLGSVMQRPSGINFSHFFIRNGHDFVFLSCISLCSPVTLFSTRSIFSYFILFSLHNQL